MPCYTTQTTTVEFGKNTDLDLLAKAFEATGEHIYSRTANSIDAFAVRYKDGKLEYDPERYTLEHVAALKRAYSEQVITATAKRNGWQLSWSTNAAGNREATVLRRG